jgi:hypothetical protein
MKIYHQTGFREIWNIDCFKDGVGDGVIYSPVNLKSDKLLKLPKSLKESSFLDPQLYLLNVPRSYLGTHPYFPGNITPTFETQDLDENDKKIAKLVVDYQVDNGFEYLVIPTRHYEDNPTTFYIQSTQYFITPFCDYIQSNPVDKKILLSVIVKNIMLVDKAKFHECLNWITSHQKIDGVYLIFENNFTSKQIKDFDFLLNALNFITILKKNGLEVHIGYCNTEALLYSIAMPDSITIGSYENLRSFGIHRFKPTDNKKQKQPNARLYSSKLLQWIDYTYIQAIRSSLPDYETYFDESKYLPLMFDPTYKWHFAKSELYKHYFTIFSSQIKDLPSSKEDRILAVKGLIKTAENNFKIIENVVLLDDDSDGSHLKTWQNVINTFDR